MEQAGLHAAANQQSSGKTTVCGLPAASRAPPPPLQPASAQRASFPRGSQSCPPRRSARRPRRRRWRSRSRTRSEAASKLAALRAGAGAGREHGEPLRAVARVPACAVAHSCAAAGRHPVASAAAGCSKAPQEQASRRGLARAARPWRAPRLRPVCPLPPRCLCRACVVSRCSCVLSGLQRDCVRVRRLSV